VYDSHQAAVKRVEGGMGEGKKDVNNYRMWSETVKAEAWLCKENQYVN
jgi:hypothetical protein